MWEGAQSLIQCHSWKMVTQAQNVQPQWKINSQHKGWLSIGQNASSYDFLSFVLMLNKTQQRKSLILFST